MTGSGISGDAPAPDPAIIREMQKAEGTTPIWIYLVLAVLLVVPALIAARVAPAQATSRTFTETGKTVQGAFFDYWSNHGGLDVLGYPISDELQEKSDADGKTYTVQYFEKAELELHPEKKAPDNVLLSALGQARYKEKYPTGAPDQMPDNSPGSIVFAQTGKRLGGLFLDYWQKNGGQAVFGYPISDQFREKSDANGQPYTVQYFQNAELELHPENPPAYIVLLSQLGTFFYNARHGPSITPTPLPTGTP